MPSLVPPVLHPALVHFPIALLPAAALVASLHRRWAAAEQALPWLLAAGALAASSAAVAGLMDYSSLHEQVAGTVAGHWLAVHRALGLGVALASLGLAVLAWLRRGRLFAGNGAWAWPAALWVVALAVLLGGWYGGALVYEPGGRAHVAAGPIGSAAPTNRTFSVSPSLDVGGLPVFALNVTLDGFYSQAATQNTIAYHPATIHVPADHHIVLTFSNTDNGTAKHDLRIDEFPGAATDALYPGQSQTIQFDVGPARTVKFYCHVDHHRQNGMEGDFVVDP